MKKISRWLALVCLLLVSLCTVSGCSGGAGKIHAPFEDSDCKGKSLDSVMSQLQSAGFTNIETVPQDTAVSFNANEVISVKIGSNTMYNTANSWEPDVKIVIKYYEFVGEETAEPTPEPSVPSASKEKELALQYCTDVYDCIMTAESAYLQYVDTFSVRVGAGEDAYALSSELYSQLDECLAFRRGLDAEAIKGFDGFADFDYNAAAYISGMMAPPKHVMDDLDGKDSVNNYDSQETAQLIDGYRTAYRESLVSFLESVGYKWDDVSSWFYDWE